MPPRGLGRVSPLQLAALLWIGSFLLYAQVSRHGFIRYDDDQYVLDNPVVRAGLTWHGVAWAFTTLHFANWHPLTWLSHMLDVQLFGLDPGKHHLVSAGLHATNAALLLVVLVRMTGAFGRSALVAALFAVHPLHVESVAWIAERKDVLSSLFGFLALAAYVRYAERPGPGRYAVVAGAFASSLCAKPMLVTLPMVLLLLDAWPLGRAPGFRPASSSHFTPAGWVQLVLEKIPLLVLSVGSSVVTVVAQVRWGALAEGGRLGLGARAANAAVSYVTYAWKIVWPARLAVFYPYSEASGAQVAGAALILLAVTAAAIVSALRLPWMAGWLWFVGTLVPVIGLVQVGGQAMADRYTYVPAIGLFVLAAWGGHALASRQPGGLRAAGVAAVFAVAAFAAASWRQLGYWVDHEALFRHAVAVTESNPRAHALLAAGLRREGRTAAALPEAEEAVRLAPSSARNWTTLGFVLHDLRRLEAARAAFERAVILDSGLGIGWMGAGLVAVDQGRLADAEEAFRRATGLAADDALSWNELGLVLAATGRLEDALGAYRRALDADPGAVPAWSNLAFAYQRLGRVAEAGEAFASAVRADPTTPATWRNLGAYLMSIGRSAEAVPVFGEALRRDPDSLELLRRLGLAQAAAGQRDAALATAQRLENRDPIGAGQIRARLGEPP